MRYVSNHSRRHIYTSSLVNEGVAPAAVSCELGHSVIGAITSIYYHTFQQAQTRPVLGMKKARKRCVYELLGGAANAFNATFRAF